MTSNGRPPKFGNSMKQTAVYMPAEMINWLKNQTGTISDQIRNLVEDKMDTALAWETIVDYCGNTKADLKNWAGMSIEQIAATLRKYDTDVLGETMDRIDQRAKAIYELANGIEE